MLLITIFAYMGLIGETIYVLLRNDHKPIFHTCASIFYLGLDLFDFWNIGVKEDFVMEEIYRPEKK